MTKLAVLRIIDRLERPDACEMAVTLRVPYSTAAMALLRLFRQGLVARYRDPESGLYWYELTPKGEARLDYLDGDHRGEYDA